LKRKLASTKGGSSHVPRRGSGYQIKN